LFLSSDKKFTTHPTLFHLETKSIAQTPGAGLKVWRFSGATRSSSSFTNRSPPGNGADTQISHNHSQPVANHWFAGSVNPKEVSMKFALKSLNTLVLAGLLATVGAGAALAQAPMPASSAMGGQHMDMMGQHGDPHMDKMGRQDPAKMQAWVAKHQADLKAKLKITAQQEAAWTTYTAAMQPPAHMEQRPTPDQRAEMDKLTTPERIDKMHALQTERMAEHSAMMKKHGDATKAFYAVLSPEQKKTFDAEHAHGAPKDHGPGHPDGPMKHKN
jgi:protein CpxP